MTTLGPTDRSRPAGEPDGDPAPATGVGNDVAADAEPAAIGPMLWGLGVREIHAALWAARGVQCVARGRRAAIDRAADLYLLLEPGQLVDFELQPHLATLFWDNRKVARLRVLDRATPSYREQIIHDEKGWVIRVERRYVARHRSSARVLITADGKLAAAWAAAATRRAGWQMVRDQTPWRHVETRRCDGETAWVGSAEDEHRFLGHVVSTWMNPGRSLTGLRHHGDGVWTTVDMSLPPDAVLIGPLWIGVDPPASALDVVVGPEVIEDRGSPELPVAVRPIREIQAVPLDLSPPARSRTADEHAAGGSRAKRLFDVGFSLAVLLATLPFFILVALAIVIEDGRPVFYAQVREGRGGKKFNCWKFRSMFNGAEARAREFQAANASDGPHVNITNDPRVTRVGRLIRRVQVDELPQFWNVLRGQMSVVGPRPSPERENQLCPAWRELRLSVQPGITGLWQIRRTRREGEDFQEWIRYDMEYVERRSFGLDMKICLLTAWMMVRGRKSTAETN
jgi:lipopolysaccharide/colanic/teichoic acid biosynthesis glycosyltransferase